MSGGKKTWYFPDGYLPEKNPESAMEAHEALMLFNTHSHPVKALITVYFSDREPMRDIEVTVPAERVISLRLDHPEDMGGHTIPLLTQYALKIKATRSIVAQFGRLDTTQSAMSYYVGVGWAE